MAWNERSRMEKRVLLAGEYLKGERPVTELCREFGISRKSAYKWVGRYQAELGLIRPPVTCWARLK